MIATQITSHVQQALDRLLQQYKGQPRLQALITALVSQVQDLENAIFSLNGGRQVFGSFGEQLDNLGTIVGIARNGLSDSVYLIFILGTIAENNSDTTMDVMTNIVSTLFSVTSVFARDLYPAAVAFGVGSTSLDPSLYNTVIAIIEASLGAGIGLAYVSSFNATDPFRFKGIGEPNKFSGFAGVSPSVAGGKLAGLIFSNSSL
jgi:uncharacterized MnhB-related membrane protein